MKLFKSKKVVAVAATAGLLLGVGGAAFAYFTSTGTGTGSGSIGTSTAVSVTGITVSGLKPGLAAVSVPYTFTNTAGNGNQNFGVASAVVSNILPAGCTAAIADLVTVDAGTAVGTVANGATFNPTTAQKPTIQMQDTGASQDACKNATFDLTVNIAAGS